MLLRLKNISASSLVILSFFLCLAKAYGEEKKQNVLILCIDDLRNQLGCLGHDYMHTPHLDSLAKKTRLFERHYVQAPTCGASRYAFLTGKYNKIGTGKDTNTGLMTRAKKLKKNPAGITPSLPAWFKQHGYQTISVGKVSHHPGGMGGTSWDDENIQEMPDAWDVCLMPLGGSASPKEAMHSLANGKPKTGKHTQPLFESYEGGDSSYTDGHIAQEAINQIKELANQEQPFFLSVGFIKPHLPFGAPADYMEHYRNKKLPTPKLTKKPNYESTWHNSNEFNNYHKWNKNPNENPKFAREIQRHYAACISYVDQLVGDVLDELNKQGLDKNTTIVVWSDHGWLLGEHGIWGKHCLFEDALLAPLMISHPKMPQKGVSTDALVESVDVYPTLCELSGLPIPDTLSGKSLLPVLKDPSHTFPHAVSYWNTGATTIRTDQYRLILHKSGSAELYDYSSSRPEGKNIAKAKKSLVKTLSETLKQQLPMYYRSAK